MPAVWRVDHVWLRVDGHVGEQQQCPAGATPFDDLSPKYPSASVLLTFPLLLFTKCPLLTTVAVAAVTETADKEAAATTVKPLDDASAATGAAASEFAPELGDGWGSFTSLFFFVLLVVAGIAFWRFGGVRYLKLCCSGSERARYRRISAEDVEK